MGYDYFTPPTGMVDVILDTDTYNEIDDQFAVSYLLASPEKFNIKGICAAPYFNEKSTSPADGMEKSYQEILKLLRLAKKEQFSKSVYRGSEHYLPDEHTPVLSDAATFMIETAQNYTPRKPLYIIAIGAITNVASALLLDPTLREKCVVVWLGGNGLHAPHNREFNLMQDVAAGRVVFGCGVPLIQLPCEGVVDILRTTQYELEHWLGGKSDLCDYLVKTTITEAESYAAGIPWSRVIWDVSTLAWFFNTEEHLMKSRIIPAPVPGYDHQYEAKTYDHNICYVYQLDRDAVFDDLFRKLVKL